MMLEGKDDWLWFMDDDHAFPPDLLLRLDSHNMPLVVPLCLQRVSPFKPVVYVDKDGGGKGERAKPIPPKNSKRTEGLVEIAGGGTAGMLIRREVFEAIDPPWFEYGTISEDLIFCDKAKAAGFPLYCDLSARLGHITTAVAWPSVYNKKWVTGMTIGRDLKLNLDISEV